MNILHPLTNRQAPITQVLNDLAAQENCDGEPYDQMVLAAAYIKQLETQVTEATNWLEHLPHHTENAHALHYHEQAMIVLTQSIRSGSPVTIGVDLASGPDKSVEYQYKMVPNAVCGIIPEVRVVTQKDIDDAVDEAILDSTYLGDAPRD